jgi:hypothetical protein
MADTYKQLGATTVTANTDTELYDVPASTETILAGIYVCNIGSTDRTFRIAHIQNDDIGNVANEDYIVYDSTIRANELLVFGQGKSMGANDKIMVRASHAEVVFQCDGVEKT